ncbi:UNVERIFIED_CONTAM: hypothetical protein RKD50_000302 [Streptomyces canus]
MPLWYGAQPAWWAPLERDARRQFGDALRHSYRRDSLTYELTGLDVIGEPDPIDVRIRFCLSGTGPRSRWTGWSTTAGW